MLGEAHLELRLVDHERNRDRLYVIEVDEGLFGEVTVTLSYGRRGSWMRSRRVTVKDRAGALRFVASCLKRRSTAWRRLGASYELVHAAGSPDVRTAVVAAWHRLGGADRSMLTPAVRHRRRPAPPLLLFAA